MIDLYRKAHVLLACLPRVSGGFLPPPPAEYLHASDRPIANTGPRAVPRQRRGSRRRHHDPRVSGAGRSIERDGVVRRVGGHARDVSGYGLDETDAGRRVVARRRGERLRHDDPPSDRPRGVASSSPASRDRRVSPQPTPPRRTPTARYCRRRDQQVRGSARDQGRRPVAGPAGTASGGPARRVRWPSVSGPTARSPPSGATAGGRRAGVSTRSRSHGPKTCAARPADRTTSVSRRPPRPARATASRRPAARGPAHTQANSQRGIWSCTSGAPSNSEVDPGFRTGC